MLNILIVEDNTDLAYGLKVNLEIEGYAPHTVDTGTGAIDALRSDRFDLVILDLTLPDISGYEVLSTLRSEGAHVPVIVLSASGEEFARVTALRLGADDYVTKPFSVLELLERIKLRLKTVGLHLRSAGLRINEARRELTCDDKPVRMTPKEFDLLCALVNARGAILSKGDLLETVWNTSRDLNTRTVDYHIASLKRRLRSVGISDAIRTVHGCGVAWTGEDLI